MLTMRIALSCLLLFLHASEEVEGCQDGFYGPGCALKCGVHCLQKRCEAVSSKGTFYCTQGCEEGWTGSTCNRKCPRGCRSCDLTSGECSDCVNGRCGSRCDQMCAGESGDKGKDNCMDSTCSKCRPGWRGANCAVSCPEHCESGCNRTTGVCDHQCVRGHHGVYCRSLCTTTCSDGCRQVNGVCIGGCQTGWYGPYCRRSCDSSCSGGMCYENGECASVLPKVGQARSESHCRLVWRDRSVVMNCSVGCEPGWRGERCDQSCPQQCYSCPRYPDSRLCVYAADVVAIKKHGETSVESGGFEFRLVYALLLVLPPFLIVGLMQLARVGYDRFKRYRDVKKRGYIVEDETSDQKTAL